MKARRHPLYTCSLHMPMLCVSEAFLRAQEVPDMPYRPYPKKRAPISHSQCTGKGVNPGDLVPGTPNTGTYVNFVLRETYAMDSPFGAFKAKHRLDDKPSGLNT